MSGGSNTVISRLVDNVFPRMPDFYGMLNQQCDLVLRSTEAFVEFMKGGATEELGTKIRAMEKEGDEIKARNMEVLSRAFATPMDREDIYRAVSAIDEILNYAKTTVREMETLGVKPDQHMVAIAELIRDGTESLRSGFSKLSSHPAHAESDAQAARKAERNSEKVYRVALAELFNADHIVQALQNKAEHAEAQAMMYVIEIFKRREIYRHLSNAADRLEHAGGVLHDIIVQIA